MLCTLQTYTWELRIKSKTFYTDFFRYITTLSVYTHMRIHALTMSHITSRKTNENTYGLKVINSFITKICILHAIKINYTIYMVKWYICIYLYSVEYTWMCPYTRNRQITNRFNVYFILINNVYYYADRVRFRFRFNFCIQLCVE